MLSKNQVKYLHSLRLRKFRDLNRAFTAEGVKLVDEFLHSHFTIQQIYATGSWIESNHYLSVSKNINLQEVTEDDLKRISNLVTPNEVLAVVNYPESGITSADQLGKIILVLDHLQDPGNLGTIIRTADWFGIRQIFCSEDTVDVFNPKVVQSTMGSICRVKLHYGPLEDQLHHLEGWHIYGTMADGENIYQATLLYPSAIVIGNESKGISEALLPLLTKRIGIPAGREGAESLNASVAAGIICSEFSRRLAVNS